MPAFASAAVSSNVAGSTLTVSSDAADAIVVGCDGSGFVTVNGAAPGSGPASCADIDAMQVVGGPGANAIDLSAVAPAAYPGLTSVDIRGGAGNDTIEGSSADDRLDGEGGVDTLTYAHAPSGGTADLYDGTASIQGVDLLFDFENVVGSQFGDVLVGDLAANRIFGLGGFDNLYGLLGDDVIFGGADEDTVNYGQALIGMAVDLTAGTATGQGTDTLSGIEDVWGSPYDDVITGSAVDNSLFGVFGNDVVDGARGNDTLMGMDGNDQIHGGTGNDWVYEDLGDDSSDDSGATETTR